MLAQFVVVIDIIEYLGMAVTQHNYAFIAEANQRVIEDRFALTQDAFVNRQSVRIVN